MPQGLISGTTTGRIVVMGVSGCGKSTVAAAVAEAGDVPFVEGDQFHSAANVAKMAAGVPLTDTDRIPWLEDLRDWMSSRDAGCVVACSALRTSYRDVLRAAGDDVVFIHIDVPEDVLRDRLDARPGHFMPASLLASQLETLEPLAPGERGAVVDGALSLTDVVTHVRRHTSRLLRGD